MTEQHIANIKKAVDAQANDQGLWFIAQRISEAQLQKSLRDLHRVIEDNDEEALKLIIEQSEDI